MSLDFLTLNCEVGPVKVTRTDSPSSRCNRYHYPGTELSIIEHLRPLRSAFHRPYEVEEHLCSRVLSASASCPPAPRAPAPLHDRCTSPTAPSSASFASRTPADAL